MNDEKKQILEVSETISKDFDKAGISSIITSESLMILNSLRNISLQK